MLYLLYGSDTLRSQQKLNEIIEEFRRAAGSNLTVYRFDAEEEDCASINAVLEGESLFQARKLVVIQHALRSRKFKSLKVQKFKDAKNAIVVLRERELDAAGVKELAAAKPWCSKIQEFRMPSSPTDDKAIFKLGDVFFTSQREARRRLLELLASGEDERYVFSYLANQARTLLAVKSYMEAREPVPTSVGIHPYVIKKASALVHRLSMEEIGQMLRRFFEEDLRVKTGLSTPKDSLLRLLTG